MEPRAGFEFALHDADVHEVPRRSAYEADAITPKPPRLGSSLMPWNSLIKLYHGTSTQEQWRSNVEDR